MLPFEFSMERCWQLECICRVISEDADGNRNVGKAHFFQSKNNFAYTTGRPIVTLGLEDTVVVETSDVVYVAKFPIRRIEGGG